MMQVEIKAIVDHLEEACWGNVDALQPGDLVTIIFDRFKPAIQERLHPICLVQRVTPLVRARQLFLDHDGTCLLRGAISLHKECPEFNGVLWLRNPSVTIRYAEQLASDLSLVHFTLERTDKSFVLKKDELQDHSPNDFSASIQALRVTEKTLCLIQRQASTSNGEKITDEEVMINFA